MRLFFLILALVFAAAGILFGALNPEPVRIDFYWFGIDASLGVLLLASALLGAILGGTALLVGVIWPLQAKLRRARRQTAAVAAPAPPEHLLEYSTADRP
jgi:uncharacterized integral membrane protein